MARELECKLPVGVLAAREEEFALFHRGLNQKRGDKNKLYSLHEPHVYCMSKGKDHKRYEFGTKVSITTTRDSKIIIGAMAFEKNAYDGHTLPDALRQLKQLMQHAPVAALCDRGYRRKSKNNETRIIRPSVNTGDTTSAYRERMR